MQVFRKLCNFRFHKSDDERLTYNARVKGVSRTHILERLIRRLPAPPETNKPKDPTPAEDLM